jgi:uncharacterized membrane protein YkoI
MKSTLLLVTLGAGSLIVGGAHSASAQAKKAPAAKHETQAVLRAEAKITEADARTTALAEVPNGKIQSHELEREKGTLLYSFDIKVPGKSGIEEVQVDAITGHMISHEHETPATEKQEAAAEAKERASTKKKAVAKP